MNGLILPCLSLFGFILSGCDIYGPPPSNGIPVYFIGGQSNASSWWASSIELEIKKSQPEAVIVYQNHGGQSISTWFDKGPGSNLIDDLELLHEKTKDLDKFFIKGIFWYQGESDGNLEKQEKYKERFIYFKQYIERHFNQRINFLMVKVSSETIDYSGIREIQQNIIDSYDSIIGIDSVGYERMDGTHLTFDAGTEFGAECVSVFSNYFLS